MPHPNAQYGEQVVEMMASLNEAISHAGGGSWSADDLRQTNMMEFILDMANNGIRFYYQKKVKND